jgi:hypothetical protein
VSSNNTELLAHLSKGVNGHVNLLIRVRCGQLCSDPSLAFGHNWIAEPNHIDTLLHQRLGHLSSQARITQHHRRDRARVVTRHREASGFDSFSEASDIRAKFDLQSV